MRGRRRVPSVVLDRDLGLLGDPAVEPAIATPAAISGLDSAPVHSTVAAASVGCLDSAAIRSAITAASVRQDHRVPVHRRPVLRGHNRTTRQSNGKGCRKKNAVHVPSPKLILDRSPLQA